MIISSITVAPVFILIASFYLLQRKGLDKAESMLIAVIYALITLAIMMLISVIIMSTMPKESFELDRAKIVALSTSATTEGTFFLASGNIEGRVYYYFYFETADGGKKLSKVYAGDTTVYEEDRKDAFVATIGKKFVHDSRKGWVFNFFTPLSGEIDRHTYGIHVPKGSIKEEITLKLPGS